MNVNLSIKAVTRHSIARNSKITLEACATWVEEWLQKGMNYMSFLNESGFDINMRC